MNREELTLAMDKWLLGIKESEKSLSTYRTYRNGLHKFLDYIRDLEIEVIDHKTIIAYKKEMLEQREAGKIKTSTINSRLIALNKFLKESGLEDLTVKLEKQQQTNSRDDALTETDFNRLTRWADKLGMKREYWIMQTLASTGCRVSELSYFTVENLKQAKKTSNIVIRNKGKERKIIVPDKTRLDLLKYAKSEGIERGVIFHGDSEDKLIDQSIIWRNFQKIAGRARVKKAKANCHNFRHLFAKRYLSIPGANILDLADYLGHSSLDTTRIYTQKTSREQKDKLNEMINSFFLKNRGN